MKTSKTYLLGAAAAFLFAATAAYGDIANGTCDTFSCSRHCTGLGYFRIIFGHHLAG